MNSLQLPGAAIDLIQTRVSTRTFDGRSPEPELVKLVQDFLDTINQAAAPDCRFVLAHASDESREARLGTYGVISGARTYLVAIADRQQVDAFKLGQLFERIVLFVTGHGLQTCWLGGTFRKADFVRSLNLAENEYIPIVSPLGYSKGHRRLLESAMRVFAKSDKRKPWHELFFNENRNQPLTPDMAGPYAIPLEMVRLAPSASNQQPWRITREGSAWHFWISRTPGYGLPGYDLQLNDLGIATCHFQLAAADTGLKGTWRHDEEMHGPAGWEYVTTWSEGG